MELGEFNLNARHHRDTIRVSDVRFYPRYVPRDIGGFPATSHLFGCLVFATVITEAPISRNDFTHEDQAPVLFSPDAELCPDTEGSSEPVSFSDPWCCSDAAEGSDTEGCLTDGCWEDTISSTYCLTIGRRFDIASDTRKDCISLAVTQLGI